MGRLLCDNVDEVANKEGKSGMSINGVPMKTTTEPCQHHQRNVCLNTLAKEMSRHVKTLLQENSDVIDSDR